MPLEKTEPRSSVPAIPAEDFEGEGLTMTFMDEGRDIEAPQGTMFLYVVKVKGEEKGLWIRPNSSRAIALAPHVPLKGKTFSINKTGTGKGTRYLVQEIQAKKSKKE